MALAEIENLLKQTIGLDAASIGSAAVARAVRDRLAVCGLSDTRAYCERVRASATELQELVEAVVVPETWFFRNGEAFTALARVAQEEWLPTQTQGVLRLLSLPCSTGEEPYSMVMALRDAGVPGNRFHVDALDISARALTYARQALYGGNSFRSADLGFRDRHFTTRGTVYRLADEVRQQVHFRQGNLFDAEGLPGAELYDAIFCRNLLIYFDRATQDRAIGVLARLLTKQGLLFVGPAETGLLLPHDFVSAKLPLAFAFRKQTATARAATPPATCPAKRASAQRRMTPPSAALKPARARPATPVAAPRQSPPVEPATGIDEATRLADQGCLVEAAKACEEHLRTHGASASAFYLMGLVRDAAGNHLEAGGYYRKALYLDPHHREALAHLALLLEKQGDTAGAQVLRRRSQRLERATA